jgi:hypothetical protein
MKATTLATATVIAKMAATPHPSSLQTTVTAFVMKV